MNETAKDTCGSSDTMLEMSNGEPTCRARMRAATPPSYRWYKHVALVAGFVILGLAMTVRQLSPMRAIDFGWLAGFLVCLNFGEYAAHRWTLHRKVFPRAIYHRHVVEHHGFFTEEAMAIRSIDDLQWVLFPWWALPLLLATTLPIALGLRVLVAAQVGWLFLFAVTVYYGIYEIVHALAHLPDDRGWGAYEHIRALTRHHRVHHDPRKMQHFNFNFVVTPFDRLFGTTFRG